jgi:hypothetical protein
VLEAIHKDSGTYLLLRGVLLLGFSARELNPRTAAFSSDAFLLLFVLVLVLSAAVLVLDSTSCRGGSWRATAGLSLICDLL